MKFKNYMDIETIREVVLNAKDYEGEVDLCILYDLENNRSCYLEVYNGEVDVVINKHYGNSEEEYDNYQLVYIEPNLNSLSDLEQQLTKILLEAEV